MAACRRLGNIVEPLGVGFPYIADLPADLYESGLVDFVEIAPETICRQRAIGKAVAIEIVPDQLARARRTCAALPIVVHGVELSIGSAHGWNAAYLEMLDDFQALWPFVWHSEHLGFQTISAEDGATLEVGVPLPLPATKEAVELVARRSAAIGERYGVPFLLENPAYYIADMPADRVPLKRVVEIHVAGGSSRDGFWMDGHNDRVPERVWEMLEYTLPRAPNVGGVVFELLDDFALSLGAAAIAEELRRVRTVWNRYRR